MNLQNIPSKNHDIRKMFKATDGYVVVSSITYDEEYFTVDRWCEVETPSGFVCANNLKVNDVLKVQDDDVYQEIIIKKIETLINSNQIILWYREDGDKYEEVANEK